MSIFRFRQRVSSTARDTAGPFPSLFPFFFSLFSSSFLFLEPPCRDILISDHLHLLRRSRTRPVHRLTSKWQELHGLIGTWPWTSPGFLVLTGCIASQQAHHALLALDLLFGHDPPTTCFRRENQAEFASYICEKGFRCLF